MLVINLNDIQVKEETVLHFVSLSII